MERPDEVLALGEVHARLAPDGGVDLREQRRRHLHDRNASVVHGGRESRHVADDTAAEREDDVVAQQAPGREVPAEAFDGGERLRRLAVTDEEQLGVRRAGAHCAGMVLGDRGLAHDGDAPPTGEQRAELAERARADDDVVGRVHSNGDSFHCPYTSSTPSTTSWTVRPSVSTSASAVAS